MIAPQKHIVAVVSDLMFAIKIQDEAKRRDLHFTVVKTKQSALAQAQSGPALIVIDLNLEAAQPLELIVELKAAGATRGIPLLAFVSHVQVDLRQAAVDAGCDAVVARSTFARDLPSLLARLTP